jgi:CheY-like chemotaxis protein
VTLVNTDASGSLTVFVAEDNPILLQGLARALSANGYRVETAIHGQALLDKLEEGPLPDLLLLDVMMPGLSGIDVLDAVRENPTTAHLPVMLITAAAEEVLNSGELGSRDVDVLMKPFRLSELLSRIDAKVGSLKARGRPESGRSAAPPVPASS